MSDEITISDLPRYGEVMSQYKVKLAEAEATGDDNQIKAVRLDWDRERFGLEKEAQEVQTKRNRLSETRETLKKEYPNIPESLLEVTDDPDKLTAIAKDAAEKMQVSTATGAGWGKGPATTAGSNEGGRVITADDLQAELAPKIRQGDREAVQTANRALFADRIGTRFGKFEEEAS
jgi:chromosome segregation ATPase